MGAREIEPTIETQLEDVTKMVWETVFELTITRDAEASVVDEPKVTSIIHLEGAWHGAVMLQCSLSLAQSLAVAMFHHPTATSLDEVKDALGEITNMIAGNVKPLLPQPCAISLPAVAFGSDYEIGVVGASVVACVPLSSDGRRLVVKLLQGTSGKDGEAR